MLVFAEAVLTAVGLGEAAEVICLAAGVLLAVSTVDEMAERALVDDGHRLPIACRGLTNVARVAQRAEGYSCLLYFFLSSIELLLFLLLICLDIFNSFRLFFFDFFFFGLWLYLNGSGLCLYLVIVLSVDNYWCIFTVNVPMPISHAMEALTCLASMALDMLLVLVILLQNCTTARSNTPNTLWIVQDHSIFQEILVSLQSCLLALLLHEVGKFARFNKAGALVFKAWYLI